MHRYSSKLATDRSVFRVRKAAMTSYARCVGPSYAYIFLTALSPPRDTAGLVANFLMLPSLLARPGRAGTIIHRISIILSQAVPLDNLN